MILNETYTLSNSVKIPKLGLGTWMLTDSEAAQAVRDAASISAASIRIKPFFMRNSSFFANRIAEASFCMHCARYAVSFLQRRKAHKTAKIDKNVLKVFIYIV